MEKDLTAKNTFTFYGEQHHFLMHRLELHHLFHISLSSPLPVAVEPLVSYVFIVKKKNNTNKSFISLCIIISPHS